MEFLQALPELVKLLGGWVTGLFTFYTAWRMWRSKQVKTVRQLSDEYKRMYIETSLEVVQLLENDALKKKVLVMMKNRCPECYEYALRKLNIEDEHI